MKNIKNEIINLNNLKRRLSAVIAAGVMTTAGTVVASAESTKVTAQDIVNAMITGNKITAEISQEEADRLVAEAEAAIIAAGASLLPDEMMNEYDSLKTLKGNDRKTTLIVLTSMCDTLLIDGTANMMTYPEALQFENVCKKVCGELIKDGNTSIYSYKNSERFGEDIYTNLDVIIAQATTNREIKKSSYITALGADLGFYDHCYGLDENPPTGSKDYRGEAMIALASLGTMLVTAPKKKKEYTKTR